MAPGLPWPRLFLCALVGWSSQTGGLGWAPVLLYAGTILWVIGYDTIYALQDIEDDALVGVKSTARIVWRTCEAGRRHALCRAFVLWNVAALLAGSGIVFAALSLLAAALMAWQVWTVDAAEPDNPRSRFYSNHYVGLSSRSPCWRSGSMVIDTRA